MGNSGSAAVGVEGNYRDCGKSVSDQLPKNRNEILHQRESLCKISRQKVLPDLGSPLRLRRTDNGDILHNGGTISARRQDCNKPTFERDVLYGSEPDLRINAKGRESVYLHDNPTKLRASRCRKKYRAPKAPPHTVGSSSPDSYQECESRDEQVSRRMRLFKTKTESRKFGHGDFPRVANFTSLQRSSSTPQFDDELRCESERLKQMRPLDTNENLITENSGWRSGEIVKPLSNAHNSLDPPGVRSDADAFEPVIHQNHNLISGLRNQNKVIERATKSSVPVKKFYFGMDMNEEVKETLTVDNFRAKLQIGQDNISGFLSLPNSDSLEVIDDENNKGGISVQLRATLPRKQLDIPQFSPLTAWRLLSCGETLQRGDNSGPCEEELEVLSSSLNNHLHHHHHYHHVLLVDKSQDSGISADDSPRIDSQAAWTPQQDLEETSSEGGFPPFAGASSESCQIARFSPRFIVSLPRDDRINTYSDHVKDSYGERLCKDRTKCDERNVTRNNVGAPLIDSNWVLSRSMPSLLNTSSLRPPQWSSVDVSYEDEDITSSLVKPPSFSYLANGGHIMYLPQYSKCRVPDNKSGRSAVKNNSFSKSCEDVTSEAVPKETKYQNVLQTKPEKKFTFQSTIRQLERKRLADKLSKEAETKENERRIELEAMRKAEEEFQRKREKEKVGIRQQLRLFSLYGNPTSTQVLSEYHIPSREYREYRNNKYSDRDSPTLDNVKKSTVHPEVTYQIPKSTQIYFNPRVNSDRGGEASSQVLGVDNYRKKFAQGGIANSAGKSETTLSSYSPFDHHVREESQTRMKGAIPLIHSNRLSEEPSGL